MSEVIPLGTNQRSALMQAILQRQAQGIEAQTAPELGIRLLSAALEERTLRKLEKEDKEERLDSIRQVAQSLTRSQGGLDPLALGQTPSQDNAALLARNQQQVSQNAPFLSAALESEDPVLAAMLLQAGVQNTGGRINAERELASTLAQERRDASRFREEETFRTDQNIRQSRAEREFDIANPTPSNLSKLVSEFNAAPEGETKDILGQGIAKATESETSMITMNPDGTISVMQGPAADLQNMQSNAAADRARESIDYFSNMTTDVDNLLTELETNPTAVGAVGSVRSFAQETLGIGVDLGTGFPGVESIINTTDAIARRLVQSGNMEEEALEGFDPTLPKLKLLESTFAFALARSRNPEKRILKSEIDNARREINLTGLTSQKAVITKLRELKRIYSRSVTDLKERLPAAANPEDGGFVGLTDEQFERFLERITEPERGVP